MKIKLATGEILGVTSLEERAVRDPEIGAVTFHPCATLKQGGTINLRADKFEIIPNDRDFIPYSRRAHYGRN